jgi:hypothetical protein
MVYVLLFEGRAECAGGKDAYAGLCEPTALDPTSQPRGRPK